MAGARQSEFSVADWRVSPQADLLSRGDEQVHLEPKAMEVLVYLASRPGEVVSRTELEQAVWRGALVGYDAVTSTVIKLRKALGDDAREPRFIATIPKRGYQLIAAVSRIETEAPAAQASEGLAAPVTASASEPLQPRWRTGLLALGVLLVIGLAVVLFAALRSPSSGPPRTVVGAGPANPPSIVVLPFANMSGDPEQEYFVDGITEDVVTDISRLSNLTVIAWTTSSTYKGTAVRPLDVAAELGVAYVLEGSVRRSGDRLRITAQLVDAENGNHVWGERYDRKLTEVFAVQDEVTNRIVTALAVRLTAAEKKDLGRTSTNNIAAYDMFLRGQRYAQERTRQGNQLARDAYRQAIALDPTYARAYGALAVLLTRDYRNDWTELPLEEARARALELAKKGVALDPSSPQAYWALGFVYLFRKQFDEAAAAARQAVELAPNYADGYGLLAFISNFQGRANDAVREIRKAMALNPHYTYDYPWNLGRAYYTLGRYTEAAEALEEANSRNANSLYPRLFLAATYIQLGRQEDAEWEIEQVEIINPETTLTLLANTFPIQDREAMQAFLEDLRRAGLSD